MRVIARPAPPDYRPSYLAAAIVTALVCLLYVLTLGPSTAMWDTSEYIAAAYIMGLPHPPGNPFFILLGRFFTLLPIHADIAGRVNLLAALSGAVSAGLWFLVTERVLAGWLVQRWQRIAGGTVAALIGGTAFTVWNQSVVNEKVYTVSLVGIALIAWLAVRWCDEPDGRAADRTLVLIAYLLGLGYANHMAGMLAAPAVAIAVAVRRPRTLVRWRLLVAGAAAMVLGLSPFVTQPIRAAYFPAINEGEPTGCRTEIGVRCTLSGQTWTAFKYNFNREQYGKPSVVERQAPFTAQLGMWWVYFEWQWLRDAHGTQLALQAILAALFLTLGALGGWVHWRKDRRSFWFFGPLMVTMSVVLIYYLNFKYGYSQAPQLGDAVDREVRDRDYFFIWSFSAWSVWAALGLVAVWEMIATALGSESVRRGQETSRVPRTRAWLAASPVLALALVPLFGNWRAATHAGDTTTRDFAVDLLNSVEPYGMLVTAGDNDTFPLWYAQHVEGIRQDVVILCQSLLNTDWYPRQLVRAPIHEYDAARGPAIYRAQSWTKPTTPPVQMTLDDVDRIPPYVEVRESQRFDAGAVTSTITPRVLTKSDIFVLRAIKDNVDHGRPIYFSRTTATYGDDLGFTPYLVTQGLARKLLPNPVAAGVDTVLVRGQGYLDLARSQTLRTDVFQGPRSLVRKGDWPDRSSINIPIAYILAGLTLSSALDEQGRAPAAAPILRDTETVIRATHTESLFQFASPLPTDSPARPSDESPALPVGVDPAPGRSRKTP
jgi:hypothetical protein